MEVAGRKNLVFMEEFIPVEVVTHIMCYLDISDRKSAAVVNRKWYVASHDYSLLKKNVFTFGCSATQHDITSVLLTSKAVNVVFDGFDSPVSMNSDFVKNFAKMFFSVQSLTLKSCDLTAAVFTAMLSQCHSLVHVNITSCNSFFMTGLLFSKKSEVDELMPVLGNVRELTLASLKYLSDRVLNRFLLVCPSVSHLSLAGNCIIFHSKDYYTKKTQDGTNDEEKANSAVLTFANIISFLRSKSPQLKILNFSRTLINDEAINSMVTIKQLSLCELYLACCSEITDDAVLSICKNQPLLIVLDISECVSVTDKGVSSISTHLHSLKKLSLAKCRQITQQSVCQLHTLQLLESLDLTACFMITTNGLKLGLCSGSLGSLAYLKLSGCSSVHDGFVIEACQQLPQLVLFDLSSCKIGNLSVLAMSRFLTNLQYLFLAWCQDVTDNGLLGLLDDQTHKHDSRNLDDDCGLCRCTRRHNTKPMAKLIKPETNNISLHHQDLLPEDLFPISHLKKLKILDLTSCHKLTDASIIKVMQFACLKKLHLGLIPHITDKSLSAISLGIPTLEELFIPQCVKVTDKGVFDLTKNLRRLTVLNVSSCDLLTNRMIEVLFVSAQGLRHLDVSMCCNITVEATEMLENNLKHLVTVHKRYVGVRGRHCI